jgi:hypothetical protein
MPPPPIRAGRRVDDKQIGLHRERPLEEPRGLGDGGRIDGAAGRPTPELLHDRQNLAAREVAHPDVAQIAEIVARPLLHEAGNPRAAGRRAAIEGDQRLVGRLVAVEHDRGEPAHGLTMTEYDFSCPFIIGYGSSPSRRDPAARRPRMDKRPPGSRARSLSTCQGLRV